MGTLECRRCGASTVWLSRALPLLIGAWLSACRQDEARPALAADCRDPACVGTPGVGVGLPSTMGDGGGAGSGGGGNMPGVGEGTLAGTVSEVITADLVSTRNLEGSVEVRALNESGSGVVATETGLGGMFRLEGIQQGSSVWVGVGTFDDPLVEPFVDTLQAVDSVRDNLVDLLVFRRDLLTELVAQAFLTSAVDLDPERAHAIVRFVREDRTPIEGVRIIVPEPEQVRTAYDSGTSYSDALDATSTRGMAILVNQSAAPYPGIPSGIAADIDGEQFTGELQLAAGAVTVVTLVVPDP